MDLAYSEKLLEYNKIPFSHTFFDKFFNERYDISKEQHQAINNLISEKADLPDTDKLNVLSILQQLNTTNIRGLKEVLKVVQTPNLDTNHIPMQEYILLNIMKFCFKEQIKDVILKVDSYFTKKEYSICKRNTPNGVGTRYSFYYFDYPKYINDTINNSSRELKEFMILLHAIHTIPKPETSLVELEDFPQYTTTQYSDNFHKFTAMFSY